MAAFSVHSPTRIRFGPGTSREVTQALPAGCRNVAVVRGKSGIAAAQVLDDLRVAGIAVSQITCPSEPDVPLVNASVTALQGAGIEAIIACGGGAVMDAGKAIAFCLGAGVSLSDDFAANPPQGLDAPARLPCIAIPTTAGTGAEVTANAVLEIPRKRAKVSLRGRAILPEVALVDPALLASAPARTLLHSGLDAVVQTMEAHCSVAATRYTDAITTPNLALGLRALRAVMQAPTPDDWANLAWVSLGSGLALANGGLGAAHGVAAVFGAQFGAPHGAVCGALLLPVLRHNLHAAPDGSDAQRRLAACHEAIAQVFATTDADDPLSGMAAWIAAQGLPGLSHYGMEPTQIPEIATRAAAASSSQRNAVPLAPADFEALLRSAQ